MKKAKYFFLSFLPFLIYIGLQFLVTIPVMEVLVLRRLFQGQSRILEFLPETIMEDLSNTSFTGFVSLLFSLIALILFGIWYHKQGKKNYAKDPTHFPIKSNFILAILCVVLYYSSNYITTLTSSVFPNAMTFYENLIQTSGLTGNTSLVMIIYAAVSGPICEELIFRGITMNFARKAFPFWLANLFQAALFGLIHMNLIQGIYAFVIGLFFGYIRKVAGTIRASIHLHIMFNVIGLFVCTYLPYFKGSSLLINLVICIAVLLLAILCCKWFKKVIYK